MYNNSITIMFSIYGFKIYINGKGYHKAYPYLSIHLINIVIKIYADAVGNIIPDTAILE